MRKRIVDSIVILILSPFLGVLGAGAFGALVVFPIYVALALVSDDPEPVFDVVKWGVLFIGAICGVVWGVFHVRDTYWSADSMPSRTEEA